MLYVIGATVNEVEEWARCTGLPLSVVQPITTGNAARGRALRRGDVVILDGAELRMRMRMRMRQREELRRCVTPALSGHWPRGFDSIPIARIQRF